MTDSQFRNSYAILGVPPDADLFQITAAYKRRLTQLQRKPTQPSEYPLLRDDYHQLANPIRRAKLDQELSELEARQSLPRAKPVPKKPRPPSSPATQYRRMMATAKATRTRALSVENRRYNGALNETDWDYRNGRIGITERDARIHLAKSDHQTRLDQIKAKFTASEAKATELFGQPNDLPESEGQEDTA